MKNLFLLISLLFIISCTNDVQEMRDEIVLEKSVAPPLSDKDQFILDYRNSAEYSSLNTTFKSKLDFETTAFIKDYNSYNIDVLTVDFTDNTTDRIRHLAVLKDNEVGEYVTFVSNIFSNTVDLQSTTPTPGRIQIRYFNPITAEIDLEYNYFGESLIRKDIRPSTYYSPDHLWWQCRSVGDILSCAGYHIQEMGFISKVLCFATFPGCMVEEIASCYYCNCRGIGAGCGG
jgi:hypothetical protein